MFTDHKTSFLCGKRILKWNNFATLLPINDYYLIFQFRIFGISLYSVLMETNYILKLVKDKTTDLQRYSFAFSLWKLKYENNKYK